MVKELKLNLYSEISWESFCGLLNICKNHKSFLPKSYCIMHDNQIKNAAAKSLT